MKLNVVGATVRDGDAVIVRVTATDKGVFEAPDAEICTLPVYVPALRPAAETETESVDGAVPDAVPEGAPEERDTLNQLALAVAVQASVPLPLFVIWIDCAAGAAPPEM